jgi:hypothetical protein
MYESEEAKAPDNPVFLRMVKIDGAWYIDRKAYRDTRIGQELTAPMRVFAIKSATSAGEAEAVPCEDESFEIAISAGVIDLLPDSRFALGCVSASASSRAGR